MASIIALFLLVIVAYFAVIAGGVALEITGIDRDMARFQALSAFTGTGYTTLAAEQIVEHRVRRRIVMALIISGWAGVASVIATMMRSLQVTSFLQSMAHLALGIAVALLGIFLLRRYTDRVVSTIRRTLAQRLGRVMVPQEIMFRTDGGLGVTRIEVPEGCPLSGVPLQELVLRTQGLTILLVEHEREVTMAGPDTVISEGDHAVVFGVLDQVERVFAPVEAAP